MTDTGSWTRTNDLRVMSPARFHCAIPVIYIVKKKRRINLIEEQLEMYDHKESVKINRIVRGCIMNKNETERWLYGSFRVTDRKGA